MRMNCNDYPTDDDATEDEEEKISAEVACVGQLTWYSSENCEMDSLVPGDESSLKDQHMLKENGIPESTKRRKGKLNVSTLHTRTLFGGGKLTDKTKKCTAIAPAFEEKNNGLRQLKATEPQAIPQTKSRHANVEFICQEENNEEELPDDMFADGFEDQDMERPSFTQAVQYPSVPLVVSDPGVQPVIKVPATINRYLRDYQRDGVCFLFKHFKENTGAILGDDMGLGKTIQVISFIAAVLGKTGTKADIFCKFMNARKIEKQREEDGIHKETGTFLIVSPGSVMYNWKDELETWGHFKSGLFHGNTKEDTLQRALGGRLDVALTTYETMRNHLDDINRVPWLAVVMDEVHRLKDHKSQITVAAKALKVKRRYGLTGTPLQNKLAEFWCVMDWANPGSLGKSKRFNREFGKPIREGQTYDATKRELALGRKKSKDLQDMIGTFFLRRTKELIANQLPKKEELVVFCPLTSFQEDVYQTLLQNPDVEMIRKKNFPCDCGSGLDRGKCCYMLSSENEDIKTITMRFFQLLLKVANHAALLAPTIKQTLDQQEKAKDLCTQVFARYPEFSSCSDLSSFELLSDPKYCGKMKVLGKLLRMFYDEHSKVLLFSRSTQLLNILEEFVISKGLVYSRLDGGTKPSERTRLVRDFNVDPSIFLCLISTKAGGLGLNFTGANVVIIFDPDWNPSSDLQAQDRAYRIGQRRDVKVYRLISSGTIEEMIYLRQVYKQQLANIAVKGTNERRYFTGVEGDKERKGELFGLENLFSYRAEGASLSKDIVKRTEKLEAGYRVAKYEIEHERRKPEDSASNETITDDGVNQEEDKDPYNLEEIASQFIEDDELPSSELKNIVDQPGNVLSNTAGYETKSQDNDYYDNNSSTVDNKAACGGVEGLLRQEIPGLGNNSKNVASKLMEFSNDFSRNKLLSLEDFFSSEDDVIEPKHLVNNLNQTKDVEKLLCTGTGDPASVIPLTAGRGSSSFICGNEKIRHKSGKTREFTNVKEKVRSYKRKTGEKRLDLIPSTSTLNQEQILGTGKSRILEESYKVKENLVRSENNLLEVSSSSENEDSDEGLFSRPRERRKRKAKTVAGETSKILKEGRTRFRRFPGKHAPDITVNGKSVAAKQSKSTNTVEQILESCGVRYTHANRHVVGPSEAENHMSKKALQDVFELKQFSQQPANCFPALEASDESDDLGEPSSRVTESAPEMKPRDELAELDRTSTLNVPSLQRSLNTGSSCGVENIGNFTVLVGSTPRGIRRRHFREMSDQLGFSSEISFAKAVVESNRSERRQMLQRFYVARNRVLCSLSCFTAPEDKTEVTAGKERQDFKRSQRPLKRPRVLKNNESLLNSKKNLKKHRKNARFLGKDVVCVESSEKQWSRPSVVDTDHSLDKKHHSSTANFHDKQQAELTNRVRGTDAAKDPVEYLEKMKGNYACRKDGNCPMKDNKHQLNHRDERQQGDEEHDIKYSATYGECQPLADVENGTVFSASILDEFLPSSSYRGDETNENEPHKIADKGRVLGDERKADDLIETGAENKGTINGIRHISVLDDFI
ncbi:DNA excision repair protein ERCC-6-like 2 [Montipora foliosa]|uniref:DNA excision repair protein ERCC-6-like 2 n=1 Tax=Montipora foliosa TaxID=591990 RepID=UPI0035F17238